MEPRCLEFIEDPPRASSSAASRVDFAAINQRVRMDQPWHRAEACLVNGREPAHSACPFLPCSTPFLPCSTPWCSTPKVAPKSERLLVTLTLRFQSSSLICIYPDLEDHARIARGPCGMDLYVI